MPRLKPASVRSSAHRRGSALLRSGRTARLTASVGISLCLVFGLACGYRVMTPAATAEHSGGARARMAVVTLTNATKEPRIELMVSDALRQEIQRRGHYRLVENPDAAEVVISGSVMGLVSRAQSVSSVVRALDYNVTLGLDLAVVRKGEGVVTLGPRVLRESESYLASADVEVERKNRDEALRRLAALLANRVQDAIELQP